MPWYGELPVTKIRAGPFGRPPAWGCSWPWLYGGCTSISCPIGAPANISALPTEIGTTGVYRFSLTASEMNATTIAVVCVDAAGSEWDPLTIVLQTAIADELHLAKAALVNLREHTVATGVDVIKDDDGSTTIRTLTPSEADGVITVTPS